MSGPNPWSQLVRMLELRKARQESSLQETRLQLSAAIQSQAEFAEGDKTQHDLVKEAQRAVAAGVKSARST